MIADGWSEAQKRAYLIADNTLLVCIVAKQPTGAVIDRFMAGLLDEGGQAKAQAQKQLFLDCVMWPAPADRTALLERFPTLPYSFGGQIFNRASGVKEEQEKSARPARRHDDPRHRGHRRRAVSALLARAERERTGGAPSDGSPPGQGGDRAGQAR